MKHCNICNKSKKRSSLLVLASSLLIDPLIIFKKLIKNRAAVFGLTAFLLLPLSFSCSAMTNLKGQFDNISAYAGNGKWLIVQAWSSGCTVCDVAMPALVNASQSFSNARLIGISLDGDSDIAQKFINKHHINFPTLLSSNHEFNNYLLKIADEGLTGTPTFLIFDPQGKLVAMQPGDVPVTTLQNFLVNKQ